MAPPLYPFEGKLPAVDPTAWIAPTAAVIGDVTIGAGSNVWYHCVLRGDTNFIRIGAGTNIQDGTIIHVNRAAEATIIGDHVTVGHAAIIHACTIGDESLIGIGAIVLNGAKIGKNCLVGAGALVTEGKEFPDGSMILGSPAKVVRQLTPEQIEGLARSALGYVENAKRFRAGLQKIA